MLVECIAGIAVGMTADKGHRGCYFQNLAKGEAKFAVLVAMVLLLAHAISVTVRVLVCYQVLPNSSLVSPPSGWRW